MSSQATASDSPFIQGRNARLYGKPVDSCPHAEGSEARQAWMQAYEEAADSGSADPKGGDATSADAGSADVGEAQPS